MIPHLLYAKTYFSLHLFPVGKINRTIKKYHLDLPLKYGLLLLMFLFFPFQK